MSMGPEEDWSIISSLSDIDADIEVELDDETTSNSSTGTRFERQPEDQPVDSVATLRIPVLSSVAQTAGEREGERERNNSRIADSIQFYEELAQSELDAFTSARGEAPAVSNELVHVSDGFAADVTTPSASPTPASATPFAAPTPSVTDPNLHQYTTLLNLWDRLWDHLWDYLERGNVKFTSEQKRRFALAAIVFSVSMFTLYNILTTMKGVKVPSKPLSVWDQMDEWLSRNDPPPEPVQRTMFSLLWNPGVASPVKTVTPMSVFWKAFSNVQGQSEILISEGGVLVQETGNYLQEGSKVAAGLLGSFHVSSSEFLEPWKQNALELAKEANAKICIIGSDLLSKTKLFGEYLSTESSIVGNKALEKAGLFWNITSKKSEVYSNVFMTYFGKATQNTKESSISWYRYTMDNVFTGLKWGETFQQATARLSNFVQCLGEKVSYL